MNNFADGSNVPISWATLESNPFLDPRSTCLPCTSPQNPPAPMPDTPAPPPNPGQAPCHACPPNATFAQRLIVRDTGPPCCTTETYGYNTTTWPWSWGGEATTPSPEMTPELWQDLYVVKNRAVTGFDYAPIFNPYVL